MPKDINSVASTRQAYAAANQAQALARAIIKAKEDGNGTFDSANAESLIAKVDPHIAAFVSALPDTKNATAEQVILDSIHEGIQMYQKNFGFAPDGGLIHTALQTGLAAASNQFAENLKSGNFANATYDDVGNTSGGSMVTNVAQLAILQAFSEAIPFGGYLPMESGLTSNLIITMNRALSKTGDYNEHDKLDGISGGKTFMSSLRTEKATSADNANFTAKIKYAKDDTTGTSIVPASVKVYINGLIAAAAPAEQPRTNKDFNFASVNNFVLKVGGADKAYSVTATVKGKTGDVTVVVSPALEAGTKVLIEAAVDYEDKENKDRRPEVEATAENYKFGTHQFSGIYRVTAEAETQWKKEVGLSYAARATLALRTQANSERHHRAVRAMYRIGENFAHSYDTKSSTRMDERTRASLFEDAFLAITQADQAMLERTGEYGISVLYVGSMGKSFFESLPESLFKPSGLPNVPNIHRIGTLKGQYQVFYVPNLLGETANSFEVLAIGRSSQIGLNPYLIGDATGAIVEEVPNNYDLTKGMTYFQVVGDSVNPFAQAAKGAALITLTNVE